MIIFPQIIWNQLLREFHRTWRRVEQVAYLDGVEMQDMAVITTITFPKAILRRGGFSVPAESMSEAGKHLGQLTRLAQVHTHPGDWVGHSDVDDGLAYSRHDGAISIVLPNYGKSLKKISDVGIHVCKNKIWRMLSGAEKERFLRIVPSQLDFRKKWL